MKGNGIANEQCLKNFFSENEGKTVATKGHKIYEIRILIYLLFV